MLDFPIPCHFDVFAQAEEAPHTSEARLLSSLTVSDTNSIDGLAHQMKEREGSTEEVATLRLQELQVVLFRPSEKGGSVAGCQSHEDNGRSNGNHRDQHKHNIHPAIGSHKRNRGYLIPHGPVSRSLPRESPK
jgi:hypothetical protein